MGTLLLGTVASCGGTTEAAGPSGAPVRGGTLRVAVADEPECLDPQQSPTAASRFLARPLVDSLVNQGGGGRIAPWLATEWRVSTDRLAYTFTLRKNVKFADGAVFDAAAVKANLDRVVNPATKSLLAASLISAYDKSTVVDEHTVEIRLKHPDSTFLSALATPNLGIQSPATLTGDPAARCATVIGTGPFRSAEGFASQKGISYTRNPDYAWPPEGAENDGAAWLDAIEIQIAPDAGARYGALTSGQVDAIANVSPTNARELGSTNGFVLHSTPYPGIPFSYWPNTASGPFADRKVRTAFRLGIDWPRITENVYFGVYGPAKGVLTPTTPGYDASLESQYRFDVAEANRLLDGAGYATKDSQGYRTKDGKRLTVRHMWSDAGVTDLATQVQAGAKEIGIETVEENLDGGTFVDRLLKGDYDLIDTNFAAPGPQVLQVLLGAENIPTPERGIANNMARYTAPAVQADFARALEAADQESQFKAYADAQRKITDDAAVFPIYDDRTTFGATSRVNSVAFLADGAPDFHQIWLSQ
ncbi:ABC transporter substrate-binding protein [Actinokineospora auranticolor]|uniref:ABC transporter substrate-binding protein n=1 Tax=Actinokineospora auranticolor TaxID=155976 RepID=UPI001C935D35|nr:ABC transporter substrate-binding protein [Actinokineospora auranticolor]